MQEITDKVLNAYGGAQQYLLMTFATELDLVELAQDLDVLCPCNQSLEYRVDTSLPCSFDEFWLHPKQLSFAKEASTKPPPYGDTSKKLVDTMTLDGYSSDEPLKLYQPAEPSTSDIFWTAYVKGMARACTLLMLLSLCHRLGFKLPAELVESFCAIKAKRHLMCSDTCSIALENAKLSSSGAIRKPHDAVMWLLKLRKLATAKFEPATVIKRWNEMSIRSDQITGVKRVSLLALLDHCDEATCDSLLSTMSCGGGGCFTDEALSLIHI